MKRFLLKIALFLLPIFILSVVADYWLSSRLKKSHSYAGEMEVWNDVYSGAAECDLAIYGSSRSWVHINSRILEDTLNLRTYNFGINGHNFWLQYFRHLEFIDNNPKPKYIIMGVDIYSLAKRKDLFLYQQFMPYMLWDKDIWSYTKSYEGFNWFDYHLPLKRYVGRKKVIDNALKKVSDKPFRIKGYRGIKKTWNEDYATARLNHPNYVIKNNHESIQLMKRFLEECRQQDIKVIFVYTPEHVLGQQFVKNRKELLETLYLISDEFKIPFLDYSNDSICENKDYYYNASHLNKTGAELFSRKLAHDLKEYISH